MTEKSEEKTRGGEWTGLALFAAGAFFTVVLAWALWKGVPETGATGTSALAKALTGALGSIPAPCARGRAGAWAT